MPNEPRWISPGELIEINKIVVEATGEPHLVRDVGLLESAAAVSANQWAYGGQDDLLELAVALLFAVARSHPSAQGNKRTGFAALDAMLRANDLRLELLDDAVVAELIVEVISHRREEAEVSALLRPHVVPVR